jgi:hypothetical protein
VESFLASLDLDNSDFCGLCAQAPDQFAEIAVREWVRSGVRYEEARWPE